MDTAPLESVYQRILGLAEQGTFTVPEDDWGAELVLAHLTVNDGLLIAAMRAVLAHEPEVRYDNADAVDEGNLRAQGPLSSLIDRLQTSSRQLVDVASQLTDGLEATEIDVHLLDGGEVVVDQPMPVGRLIEIHGAVHLPSHLSQLEQLRS
jgi:hypothetical protein